MKYKVVSVRDLRTGIYLSPQFVAHEGQVIRAFADAVNSGDPKEVVAQHPEDFELFTLGEWDDHSGLFDVGVPSSLVAGKSLLLSRS